MNRKFAYVCAGVLVLALAGDWRAREAAGQVMPEIEATCYDNGAFYAVFGGEWHQVDTQTGGTFLSYPLPVQAPVVGTGNHMVLYRNGDLLRARGLPRRVGVEGQRARRRPDACPAPVVGPGEGAVPGSAGHVRVARGRRALSAPARP